MTRVADLPLRGGGGEPVDFARTIVSHGVGTRAEQHRSRHAVARDDFARPRRRTFAPSQQREREAALAARIGVQARDQLAADGSRCPSQPRVAAGEPRMPTDFEIPLRGPGGEPVDLLRTFMSHGVADLLPGRVDEAERTYTTTLALPRTLPRTVRISEGRSGFARVEIEGRRLGQRGSSCAAPLTAPPRKSAPSRRAAVQRSGKRVQNSPGERAGRMNVGR
jgi:hypothetical protein